MLESERLSHASLVLGSSADDYPDLHDVQQESVRQWKLGGWPFVRPLLRSDSFLQASRCLPHLRFVVEEALREVDAGLRAEVRLRRPSELRTGGLAKGLTTSIRLSLSRFQMFSNHLSCLCGCKAGVSIVLIKLYAQAQPVHWTSCSARFAAKTCNNCSAFGQR